MFEVRVCAYCIACIPPHPAIDNLHHPTTYAIRHTLQFSFINYAFIFRTNNYNDWERERRIFCNCTHRMCTISSCTIASCYCSHSPSRCVCVSLPCSVFMLNFHACWLIFEPFRVLCFVFKWLGVCVAWVLLCISRHWMVMVIAYQRNDVYHWIGCGGIDIKLFQRIILGCRVLVHSVSCTFTTFFSHSSLLLAHTHSLLSVHRCVSNIFQ